MRISPLVDHVYFNPDHPENHTVKLKSEKRSRVMIHQDGKWVEVDMNASIDSMMLRENINLTKFFFEEVWPDPLIDYDVKARKQTKLIKINDKDRVYFEQRRSIQAMLKMLSEGQK
jgi:hypothetical protein